MSSNIVPLQPYPGHPLRALKKFAAKADQLVRRDNELNQLWVVTYEKIAAMENGEQLAELIDAAKKTATLDQHDKTVLAWCEAALLRFDPNSNYEPDDDDDYYLKPSVVGARVAVLVGSFPSTPSADPSVFLKAMVEAICSVEDLSLVALDAAIWEAVGTLKFIPSVSELTVIVKRQKERWNKRICAIQGIAEMSEGALAEIAELAEHNTGTPP